MSSRVICKKCDKTWATRDEYLRDKVKCGGENCPLTHGKFGFKEAKEVRRKRPEVIHMADAIYSEVDPAKVDTLYVEVPKVLYTIIKLK